MIKQWCGRHIDAILWVVSMLLVGMAMLTWPVWQCFARKRP
jgi:hypothetical protein